METFLVSAAAEIMHLHYALVTNNNGLFQIDTAGTHVTACRSCCFQQFRRRHLQLVDVAGIDDFNIVDFVVTSYKAEDQAFFAGIGNSFDGFFYRKLQVRANISNGLAVRCGNLLFWQRLFCWRFNQIQFSLFRICRIIALRAVAYLRFPGIRQHHELMRTAAADSAAVRFHRAEGQTAAGENF